MHRRRILMVPIVKNVVVQVRSVIWEARKMGAERFSVAGDVNVECGMVDDGGDLKGMYGACC